MIILFFALMASANPKCLDGTPKYLKDIKSIEMHLKRHINKKSVPPKELAPVIYSAALRYNVSAKLLTQVIMTESRGVPTAYNKKSHDFGIAQIHIANGDQKKITCAMDWRCGVFMGAEILSKANRPCAFNTGNRGSIIYPKTCLNYENRLATIN